jgi:hypothetical protein
MPDTALASSTRSSYRSTVDTPLKETRLRAHAPNADLSGPNTRSAADREVRPHGPPSARGPLDLHIACDTGLHAGDPACAHSVRRDRRHNPDRHTRGQAPRLRHTQGPRHSLRIGLLQQGRWPEGLRTPPSLSLSET